MTITPKPETPTMLRAEDILTPKQLSKRLQLPISWIYEKSRKGGKHGNPLPVLRCGRYLRFSWSDVCAWVRQNQAP
jgi:predicted DNA-binding transcriptional regulator AlpA